MTVSAKKGKLRREVKKWERGRKQEVCVGRKEEGAGGEEIA